MVLLTIIVSQSVFAEQEGGFSISPFINYNFSRFWPPDDTHSALLVHSIGEGVELTKGNLEPSTFEDRNGFRLKGEFKQYFIYGIEDEYKGMYNEFEIKVERMIKRHFFLGIISTSAAKKPVFGGLHTFIGGLGYGYEIIRKEGMSLIAGCGLAVSDFGIELSNGTVWPILPVPIIFFEAGTQLFEFSFEFLKDVKLELTFFPEKKLELSCELEIDPFDFGGIRDLGFDAKLVYRFSQNDHMLIGLGIQKNGFGFLLSEKGKEYGLDFYSAYGFYKVSFLKLIGGYSFAAREVYNGDRTRELKDGFFAGVSLGWSF